MKAFEFEIQPSGDGIIAIPPELVGEFAGATSVKVIVLLSNEDEEAWQKLTTEQFFKGYAPSDAIYDDLPAG